MNEVAERSMALIQATSPLPPSPMPTRTTTSRRGVLDATQPPSSDSLTPSKSQPSSYQPALLPSFTLLTDLASPSTANDSARSRSNEASQATSSSLSSTAQSHSSTEGRGRGRGLLASSLLIAGFKSQAERGAERIERLKRLVASIDLKAKGTQRYSDRDGDGGEELHRMASESYTSLDDLSRQLSLLVSEASEREREGQEGVEGLAVRREEVDSWLQRLSSWETKMQGSMETISKLQTRSMNSSN